MKPLTLSIIILISFSSNLWASQPLVRESSILFPSTNKVITYTTHMKIYSDPEEANKHHKPVYVTEKPLIVSEWERLLVIVTGHYYEDITISIKIYDFNGNFIRETKTVFGGIKLHLMKQTKRILLCQQSGHYEMGSSYLLDSNGALVQELKHGSPARYCASTANNEFFWIIVNKIKPALNSPKAFAGLLPYSIVSVYDKNGLLIKSFKTEEKKDVIINNEDEQYTISVPEPEIPG